MSEDKSREAFEKWYRANWSNENEGLIVAAALGAWKAAIASVQPEIDENRRLASFWTTTGIVLEQTEQQLAASNEKVLAQQASILRWKEAAEKQYGEVRRLKYGDEDYPVEGALNALVTGSNDGEDLSALQAHNAKYEARIAQLVDAAQKIVSAIGTDNGFYKEFVALQKDLSTDPSDWLAAHNMDIVNRLTACKDSIELYKMLFDIRAALTSEPGNPK